MVNVAVRLKFNRYRTDRNPHILVDFDKCRGCPHKACLTACPAQCYLPHPEDGVTFNYQACLECGTCHLICDQGALKWNYPRGGCGISFRFS